MIWQKFDRLISIVDLHFVHIFNNFIPWPKSRFFIYDSVRVTDNTELNYKYNIYDNIYINCDYKIFQKHTLCNSDLL